MKKTYRQLVVELACIRELRPARCTPDLLPTRVRIRACPVPAVDQAYLCGCKHLRRVEGRVLYRRVIAGDSVAWVKSYEVRKVTVCIAWRVHVNFPFYVIFRNASTDCTILQEGRISFYLGADPKIRYGYLYPSVSSSSSPL